jgi:hypothetical protein
LYKTEDYDDLRIIMLTAEKYKGELWLDGTVLKKKFCKNQLM